MTATEITSLVYGMRFWLRKTLYFPLCGSECLLMDTLSRVLNGHAGISPDMAIRLEKAGWPSAEFWLRRQASYDLAQARKHEDKIRVERYLGRPA